MIPTRNISVLKLIADKLKGTGIKWALTGSTNLVLQGVAVEVHDIDILTDKLGSIEIGQKFRAYETEPVKYSESDLFRSYHGKFAISGVMVDVMGDIQHKTPDGNWVDGGRLVGIKSLNIDDFSLPVLDLRVEYKAYLSMGRTEKAKKIKEAIEKKKNNIKGEIGYPPFKKGGLLSPISQ